jgi:hypothetical protein
VGKLAANEHVAHTSVDLKGGCLKGFYGAAGPEFMLRLGFYYSKKSVPKVNNTT